MNNAKWHIYCLTLKETAINRTKYSIHFIFEDDTMTHTKAFIKVLTTLSKLGLETNNASAVTLAYRDNYCWLYFCHGDQDFSIDLGFFQTEAEAWAYFADGRKSARFLKKALLNSIVASGATSNAGVTLPEIQEDFVVSEEYQKMARSVVVEAGDVIAEEDEPYVAFYNGVKTIHSFEASTHFYPAGEFVLVTTEMYLSYINDRATFFANRGW
ncbi:MAG: hypothetical protein ACRCSY_04035 [Cetobacterium sp.]